MRLGRSISCLLLAGALALAASAQSPSGPEQETCTDLSGKVALPCPGQSSVPTIAPGSAQGQEPGPAPRKEATQQRASERKAKAKTKTKPQAKKRRAEEAGRDAATSGEEVGATSLNGVPINEPEPPSGVVVAGPAVAPKSAAPTSLNRAPIDVKDSRAAIPDANAGPATVNAGASVSLRRLPLSLLQDQKDIWLSPLRARLQDVQWLAPLLGATAITIAADRSIERELPTSPKFIKRSKDFSNYGAAAFAAATGGAYVWSRLTGNEHMRETAVLSGEAAVDTLGLTYAIKSITRRDRPLEGNGTGRFWSSGDSFPSEHAAAAWSIATVFAHQYPGPITTLLAYGGAGAITAARVTGGQHFASDALVGSALGWLVARQVLHNQHERVDNSRFGTFERSAARESPRDPANMGSPYVPLDNWVYPAMDRLAALGYVRTSFAGLRPWTRMECVRLLDEAADQVQSEAGQSNNEAVRLVQSLQMEFALDAERSAGAANLGAGVDSIYARVTGISGPSLTEGFHFGQTVINDYGRPYEQGANFVGGITAHAEAGPLVVYVRGEYQHAPFAPPLPETARNAIYHQEFPVPMPPATPFAEINRFRLVEGYVGLQISNWQLSFGRQSQLWGPGSGGALMFSNNAEPIAMVRLDRVKPFRLPSIFGLLGPVRTQYFFGQLEGHHFIGIVNGVIGSYDQPLSRQPYISGEKFSFEPTPNFQFGVSVTDIISGGNVPLTAHTFFNGVLSRSTAVSGTANDPGDRRAGVDWSYRLPGLRNWVTFYGDAFTDDEYSPLAYPDRSAIRAGIYLPRLPKINKLDFRAEGVFTDVPAGGNLGHGFFYSNGRYRDGYTNDGNLIGSWIGREGQGAQAWSSYHFSPRSSIEVGYRHEKVSKQFVGGGTLYDVSASADLLLRRDLSLRSLVQYERWTFPALSALPQSNLTASFQLTYHGLKLRTSPR
jgi:membrane-associated phospholipid phosphatase